MLSPSLDVLRSSDSLQAQVPAPFPAALTPSNCDAASEESFRRGSANGAHSMVPDTSADMDSMQAPPYPQFHRASSVSTESSQRLQYWRSATGKNRRCHSCSKPAHQLEQQPQTRPELSSIAPAQSGPAAVGRSEFPSRRHRLSYDHVASNLPIAGLLSCTDEKTKVPSGRYPRSARSIGGPAPVVYQSESLYGGCNDVSDGGSFSSSYSFRGYPMPNSPQEQSQRASSGFDSGEGDQQQHHLDLQPSPAADATSPASVSGRLMVCPATTCLRRTSCDGGSVRSTREGGACLPATPAHDLSLGACANLRSQSDRMGDVRIVEGYPPFQGPRMSQLERYHSLQDGDVIPRTDRRTHSFGGPMVPMGSMAAASPAPRMANVFVWAAKARMDAKSDLSRRSSV